MPDEGDRSPCSYGSKLANSLRWVRQPFGIRHGMCRCYGDSAPVRRQRSIKSFGAKRPIEYILIAIRARSFAAAVLRAADGMIRWEYAFVDRAGRLDQTGSLEVGFRDKTDDFAHRALQGWKTFHQELVLGLPGWKTRSHHKNLFLDGCYPVKDPPPFEAPEKKSARAEYRFLCRRREAEGPGPRGFDHRVVTGP
jgi:hypothetical protein